MFGAGHRHTYTMEKFLYLAGWLWEGWPLVDRILLHLIVDGRRGTCVLHFRIGLCPTGIISRSSREPAAYLLRISEVRRLPPLNPVMDPSGISAMARSNTVVTCKEESPPVSPSYNAARRLA